MRDELSRVKQGIRLFNEATEIDTSTKSVLQGNQKESRMEFILSYDQTFEKENEHVHFFVP